MILQTLKKLVVQLLLKKPLLNPVEPDNLAELDNPAPEIFPIGPRQDCTPSIKASLQFGILMAPTWGAGGNCNSEGLSVTTPCFMPIRFLDQETQFTVSLVLVIS